MKAFNLEEAKRNTPVITRDGRNARLICFDRKSEHYPLVALLDKGENETVVFYSVEGKYFHKGNDDDRDLFINEGFDWLDAPVICELNDYRYLLGPELPGKCNWFNAKFWCESVGGELPTREILLLSFISEKIKEQFKNDQYWSATEACENNSWCQNLQSGYQSISTKNVNNYVRAIKKVPKITICNANSRANCDENKMLDTSYPLC